MVRLPALVCCALLPGVVLGEGAVRLFDCDIVRVCDGAGECRASTGTVAFRLEPVQVGQDGAGQYRLRYGETAAPLESLSDVGPFVWTVGDERHTLLVSSESELLWHRLATAPVPTATLTFLRCGIRQ